ncbi:MAG: hypothetical protein ACLUPG_11135 [Roseburia faecis]
MWKKKKDATGGSAEPVFRKGLQPGAGTVRLAGTKPENNFVGGDFDIYTRYGVYYREYITK